MKTAISAALTMGMIGAAYGQDDARVDPAKVEQVQRTLERNPELRERIFKAMDARDETTLQRSLKESGVLGMFEEPSALGWALCLVDGIPMPSNVCQRFIFQSFNDWAEW